MSSRKSKAKWSKISPVLSETPLDGDRFGATLSCGRYDHDFSYDVDAFKISGDFGTSSYDSNVAPSDWRLSGTAGISYFFSPNKEFSLDGYVSQFDDGKSPDWAVSAGFKLGF